MVPGSMRARLVLLGTLLAAQLASGSFLTVASAANITRCLSTNEWGKLVLDDCINGIGAEWNWTLSKAEEGGRLQVVGLDEGYSNEHCLDENLNCRPCDEVPTRWAWDRKALQLQIREEGNLRCLGISGQQLLVEQCSRLTARSPRDDQSGTGVPAEQTWVLFPTDRPQIRVLDSIQFPLSVSGRFIVDSDGRRVKLAGINWVGSQLGALVNGGLAVAPLRRIVRTIKYMGFNSVRLGYTGAMHRRGEDGELPKVPHPEEELRANPELQGKPALEVFDAVVEEITAEGLLVVITRHADGDGALWYDEDFPEESWLQSLTFMAERYKDNRRVIGFDLLSELRARESNRTIPWWGSFPRLNNLTSLFGYRFADWRAAASKGAVAVWAGDENALVIVEGQTYSTDLAQVLRRPLKLHQECLASRVVYATHEYRSYWHLASFSRSLWQSLQPWSFGKDLVEAARVAESAADADAAGRCRNDCQGGAEFSYADGGPSVTYDAWVQSRISRAFYLLSQDLATVLVSEFGTHRDDAWWDYMLLYLRRSDASWCYWAMDGAAPGGVETYGIFAPGGDYTKVVGWKLQDLLEIQAPAPDDYAAPATHHASSARRLLEGAAASAGECAFEYAANREAAQEPTGLAELLATARPSPMEALAALIWLLALLLPALLCCLCCRCCCFRRPPPESTRAWPVGPKEMSYLTLNSHRIDATLETAVDAMAPRNPLWIETSCTPLTWNGVANGERPSRAYAAPNPAGGLPERPTSPRSPVGPALFCCASSTSNRHKMFVPGVYS